MSCREVKMANINRTNSPMNLYRDNYLETKEELDKARELVINEQKQKPSFMIGSIERVNERIACLDKELQTFASSLVIESQLGPNVEDYIYPSTDDSYGPVKARDVKELHQFAGVYSVKSTLTDDQTSRGKYHTKKTNPTKNKKETKAIKPKLVELFQFRGFDEKRPTPLPEVDSGLTILERVTDAQSGLHRKPHYKEAFKRLFHSTMSEAVLVDCFWWFFLNHYHPNKEVQPKLFDRVAHNYVKLFLSAKHPKYRDIFFQTYADVLAQAMYAAFCAVFPDSWRQFERDFISEICDLTGLWVAGTKPAPESWKGWNFEKLEPTDLRKEVILKKDPKKKGNVLVLELSENDIVPVDARLAVAPSEHDGRTGRAAPPSVTGGAAAPATRDHSRGGGGGGHKDGTVAPIDAATHARAVSMDAGEREPGESPKTNKVTAVRRSKECKVGHKESLVSSDSFSLPSKHPRSSKRGEKPKVMKPANVAQNRSSSFDRSLPVPLRPASECTSLQSPKKSTSHIGVTEEARRPRESHSTADGPTFKKTVFNTSGHSPLVKQFLQKKGLEKKTGMEILLQRTEIDLLPPAGSQTYHDVVHDSLQSIHLVDEKYKQMYDDGLKEHAYFIKTQRHKLKEHMRRENALMSQPRELKRLSDLLVLELLKDLGEVNTGAAQAVEDALLQQDRDSS